MMEEKRPLISVVMPLYNAEKYIGESIESILGQSEGDFELIIVDDASTDASFTVAREYAARDERIVLLRNAVNSGAALTRNRALDAARGEFIAFMDADDLCPAERFARQVGFFRQHPGVDLCGSYYTMFVSDDTPALKIHVPLIHEEICFDMLFGCPFAMPSVMIRREPFVRSGIRFRKSMAEDYLLWADLSEHLCMANIPEYLLYYRRWENQISTSQLSRQTDSAQIVQQELLKRNFGLELTEKDARIFTHLSLRREDMKRSDLTDYSRILKLILQANRRKDRYDNKLLRRQLLRRYKTACLLFYPLWAAKIRKRLFLLRLIAS